MEGKDLCGKMGFGLDSFEQGKDFCPGSEADF